MACCECDITNPHKEGSLLAMFFCRYREENLALCPWGNRAPKGWSQTLARFSRIVDWLSLLLRLMLHRMQQTPQIARFALAM
eukprot:2938486-Amphidinium_carterae.2